MGMCRSGGGKRGPPSRIAAPGDAIGVSPWLPPSVARHGQPWAILGRRVVFPVDAGPMLTAATSPSPLTCWQGSGKFVGVLQCVGDIESSNERGIDSDQTRAKKLVRKVSCKPMDREKRFG